MADEGSIAVKCIYGQNNVRCCEKYYGQVYFMCSSCHALWFRFVFRYAQIDSLEPLFSPQRALCSSISREALIFEDILRICYVIFMSRFLVFFKSTARNDQICQIWQSIIYGVQSLPKFKLYFQPLSFIFNNQVLFSASSVSSTPSWHDL